MKPMAKKQLNITIIYTHSAEHNA